MVDRFKVSKAGPRWFVCADTGAEVARFDGATAEHDARALAAKLNGRPIPAAPKPEPRKPEPVAEAPKPGAWAGDAEPQPGRVYSLSGLAGGGVAEDVTEEVNAAQRARELAGRCSKGGQVVRYSTFGGGERRAVVTRWHPDVKNGRPGFDAVAIGDGALSDGFEVWGYASQVVAFEGEAEAPEALSVADERARFAEAAAAESSRLASADDRADPAEGEAESSNAAPTATEPRPDRVTDHPQLPASWYPEGGGYVRLLEADRAGVSFRRAPPMWIRSELKAGGYRYCPDDVEWVGPLANLPRTLRPSTGGGAV